MVVLGKARQETGGGDTAATGPAAVGQVGEVALELLLVVVPQGHAPGAVVAFDAGGE